MGPNVADFRTGGAVQVEAAATSASGEEQLYEDMSERQILAVEQAFEQDREVLGRTQATPAGCPAAEGQIKEEARCVGRSSSLEERPGEAGPGSGRTTEGEPGAA